MKTVFFKSNWEVADLPLEHFLERARAAHFDGVEVFLGARAESDAAISSALEGFGLRLIAQVITAGPDPQAHLDSFARQLDRATATGAEAVNAHAGSDFFLFEQNLRLMEGCLELGAAAGVPVWFETHRGRALYNLPGTLQYLEALPELRLVADISHFMVVHESDLRSRGDLLERLVSRVRHIHARVGHPEGPQGVHPLAPECSDLLHFHRSFWARVLSERALAGAVECSLTPEAGPPPYMPTLPFTSAPLADPWQVNVVMRDWLRQHLRPAH